MKVLVIDDEPQIRRALKLALEQDFEVLSASNGEDGINLVATATPDVVILDLSMPGMDGFDVCRRIRSWSEVPIIILSARDNEDDKIEALDLGADDYITKPFGMRELFARMRAVLRRVNEDSDPSNLFTCGPLTVDFSKRSVLCDGQEVHLTPKEYDLLCYMVKNPNRVLTHKQLLHKVWGQEYVQETHTLRVHIANLRTKIESSPERPRFVQTETRVGYRFRTE